MNLSIPLLRRDENTARTNMSLYPSDRERLDAIGRFVGIKNRSAIVRFLMWSYDLPSDNGKEKEPCQQN